MGVPALIAASQSTRKARGISQGPEGWRYDFDRRVAIAPDGTKYPWKGAGDPTEADLDEVIAGHRTSKTATVVKGGPKNPKGLIGSAVSGALNATPGQRMAAIKRQVQNMEPLDTLNDPSPGPSFSDITKNVMEPASRIISETAATVSEYTNPLALSAKGLAEHLPAARPVEKAISGVARGGGRLVGGVVDVPGMLALASNPNPKVLAQGFYDTVQKTWAPESSVEDRVVGLGTAVLTLLGLKHGVSSFREFAKNRNAAALEAGLKKAGATDAQAQGAAMAAERAAGFVPKDLPGYEAGAAPDLKGMAEPGVNVEFRNPKAKEPRAASRNPKAKPEPPIAKESEPIAKTSEQSSSQPPPVEEPPKFYLGEGQGVRHEAIDAMREEMGWKPREGSTKTDAEVMQEARQHAGSESTIADRINAEGSKETLTESETAALGVRLKNLADQMREAKGSEKWDVLDAEAQKIADALDASGSRQGRAFRARQYLLQNSFDEWSVMRRAEKAKGSALSDAERSQLQDLLGKHETATQKIADLEAELAKLKTEGGVSGASRRKATRERIQQERQDIFAEIDQILKESQGAGLHDLGSAASTALSATARLTAAGAKLAWSYAREGGVVLADVVDRVVAEFAQRGVTLDRQALIDEIGKHKEGRTRTEIERDIAKFRAEAHRATTEFKAKAAEREAITAEKRQGREQARREVEAARKAEREALRRDQAAARAVDEAESAIEKARAKEAKAKAAEGLRVSKMVAREKEKIAAKEFGEKWQYAERAYQYEQKIADLQNQLDTGAFRVPSKRESQLVGDLKGLSEETDRLRRQVQARIRAMEPHGPFKSLENLGRGAQLLNLTARVVDLTANTAKLGAYIVENPARSLLSELSFGKTAGREKLFNPIATPKRFAKIVGNPKRVVQEIRDIWKGIDLDTLEKYGKSGGIGTKLAGITDVVFKDFYNRLALDDFATGYAKEAAGARGKATAQFREAAFKQLTEGADGPLTDAQVLEAKTSAHDWALRQTFNIDNIPGKVAEGFKNAPAQFLKREGHPHAAEAWSAFADMNTRFTKVITNVALEKANRMSLGGVPLGPAEATIRTVVARFPRRVMQTGGKKVWMAPRMSAMQSRLVADLAVKGLTGLASFEMGKWVYQNYLKGNDQFKGEIASTEKGFKFVRWTFAPGVAGGLDMQQIGAGMAPLLAGATYQMIQESDLTDNQKADLWKRYQLSEAASTPLGSNVQDLIELSNGEVDVMKYLGNVISRQVIPGQVRDVAERMDQSRTGVQLRKASGFWEQFQKRIPVFRESLSANEKRS